MPSNGVGSFDRTRHLMAEVKGLKLMPHTGLEEGCKYQLRVRAVCRDQNVFIIFSSSECFKTDWYTINFY